MGDLELKSFSQLIQISVFDKLKNSEEIKYNPQKIIIDKHIVICLEDNIGTVKINEFYSTENTLNAIIAEPYKSIGVLQKITSKQLITQSDAEIEIIFKKNLSNLLNHACINTSSNLRK